MRRFKWSGQRSGDRDGIDLNRSGMERSGAERSGAGSDVEIDLMWRVERRRHAPTQRSGMERGGI